MTNSNDHSMPSETKYKCEQSPKNKLLGNLIMKTILTDDIMIKHYLVILMPLYF